MIVLKLLETLMFSDKKENRRKSKPVQPGNNAKIYQFINTRASTPLIAERSKIMAAIVTMDQIQLLAESLPLYYAKGISTSANNTRSALERDLMDSL